MNLLLICENEGWFNEKVKSITHDPQTHDPQDGIRIQWKKFIDDKRNGRVFYQAFVKEKEINPHNK